MSRGEDRQVLQYSQHWSVRLKEDWGLYHTVAGCQAKVKQWLWRAVVFIVFRTFLIFVFIFQNPQYSSYHYGVFIKLTTTAQAQQAAVLEAG